LGFDILWKISTARTFWIITATRATRAGHEENNPLCGDVIRIDLHVTDDNVIDQVSFEGQGCAISQASASMLTEMIQGKTLDEVKQLGKEDILEALGIEIGPVRLKCALLPLKVLKAGAYGLPDWTGEDEENW
jgi:nitrogen fixation NifU-like protein